MSTATTAIVSVQNQNGSGKHEESILQFLLTELERLNIATNVFHLDSPFDTTTDIISLNDSCKFIFFIGDNGVAFQYLANIFDEKLVCSQHLAKMYLIKDDENSVKDITIPDKSTIFQVQDHLNGINPVLVKYKNIFVLPNDDTSVRTIFNNLLFNLLLGGNESFKKIFRFNSCLNSMGIILENKITNTNIDLKCYCTVQNSSCTLTVELSGSDFNTFIECEEILKKLLPKDMLLDETICDNFWRPMDTLSDKYITEAINVIKECYLKYEPKDVFLSFNGGKDCTVLLYLVIYILKKLHPNYTKPLVCVYIQSKNPFAEVEDFIKQCETFYNLEVVTICSDIKTGLGQILADQPSFKACLMGTRRTDPFSENLKHFQMTDAHWPQIMRVNPIINWSYSEVWDFMLKTEIPYCVLYDRGYTSLGSTVNTIPNPALQSVGDKYLPAYRLVDGSHERHGRLKN